MFENLGKSHGFEKVEAEDDSGDLHPGGKRKTLIGLQLIPWLRNKQRINNGEKNEMKDLIPIVTPHEMKSAKACWIAGMHQASSSRKVGGVS